MAKWLMALPLVLCFSVMLRAQDNLSLTGTVRDATGVVAGATVVLSSGGSELSSATSDAMGTYRFDNLAAGSYELSFSRQGFESIVRNVTLSASTGPIDVVLAVGRVSTTLTVTALAGMATATHLPVPDDDVPAQVSSIPQELLQRQAINSVGEAVKNASGVQSFRWYGVYEQYTIRGFNDPDRDANNAVLVEGLRFSGNRYATQTNNVESLEVLKGPSSILYGRGSVGGSINIVRKKPQRAPGYSLLYRGGRFNTHQVAGSASGALRNGSRFLYRMDASYDHSDGWRDAGWDRLNLTPSITWEISEGTRLTVQETFNRDRFDGDGGIPLNIIGLPSFRPTLRFSLPQDNVLVKDSQTLALFSASITPTWSIRNNFKFQRTSDRYFVTEGGYGDPDNNQVFREPLDFHHRRTPVQNQTELVGRLEGFGRHNLLFGYEYYNDNYRTDVTAGDDPDCVCGYWWITIAPMNISTLEETNPPLDTDTIARQTFVKDQTHALYWQDQIDILPQLKVNVGGRWDNYRRRVDRLYLMDPGDQFPDGRFELSRRNQDAYTYRAGIVYAPQFNHQIYFGASSSFTPETTVPESGAELEPRTARNYEVGYRWQGWNGRIDTTAALYYVIQNNLGIVESPTTVVQA
jgi:iron complex outermembrane receptor protein